MQNDPLEIPDFLKRKIKDTPGRKYKPRKIKLKINYDARPTRLTLLVKEREARNIRNLIASGENTYAKLKKHYPEERVLKAALRYGLSARSHPRCKIYKQSKYIYAIRR